jgi:hypothetical protein
MERPILDKADQIVKILQENKFKLYYQIIDNLASYHAILVGSFSHVASMEVKEEMFPEIIDYYKKVILERENPVYLKWYGFDIIRPQIYSPFIIKRKNDDFSFNENRFKISLKASNNFWYEFEVIKNSNYKEIISNEFKKYESHSNPDFILFILNLIVKDLFPNIKRFTKNGFALRLTNNLSYEIIYINADSKRKLKYGFVDNFEVEVYLIKKNNDNNKKEKYFVCELKHPFGYYTSIGYFEGLWRFHDLSLKSFMPFQIFYCYFLKFFFAKQFLDFITEGILQVYKDD